MGYPIILGGDHAEFEQEWTASGRPDRERPDWPLPSFDAADWAAAFCSVVIEKGFRPDHPEDEDWVRGWFANALMRGYDEHAARARKPRSWFWHGRFEGAAGGYTPPDGFAPRILYRIGNVVGRILGTP